MTKRIYKFNILVATDQEIHMPRGARVLSVQTQHDTPQMWVLVDDTQPYEGRVFSVYGTGHSVPEDPGRYRGTWQEGSLVWHLFENAAS